LDVKAVMQSNAGISAPAAATTYEHGNIVNHKAQFITEGFVQREGINFERAFVLMARMEYVAPFAGTSVGKGP
jgi:hypothetical protein